MRDSSLTEESVNRKNIFIVGPTESLLTQRGTRHPALASFLVSQGYRLEYITSDFYHAEKRWFSGEEIKQAQEHAPYKLTVMRCLGYKTNISARRVISNILLSLRFFFYLLPRVNSKTVLILPSRPVEMIFAAAMLRLLRRMSVVLDIQDIWPDALVTGNRLKRGIFSVYCNLYLYPALPIIDKFFHVAPSFVSWLHRYHPRAISTFIPLGYDADRWHMVSPDRKREDDRNILLVCVAKLQYQIDVMPVLKAIVDHPDIHLTLIGDDGDGDRYPDVIDFIEANQMRNVTIIGCIKPKIMGEHLRKMDVGVVPMISSSIPNKVFDYIACYLPILVLGKNDCSEFVEKHKIGWSVAYSRDGVRRWTDEVTQEAILDRRRNIMRVRPEFDRSLLFAKVKSLIESVASMVK